MDKRFKVLNLAALLIKAFCKCCEGYCQSIGATSQTRWQNFANGLAKMRKLTKRYCKEAA